MCNQCQGYYAAQEEVYAIDPSLRRAAARKFWSIGMAYREFIIECHAIPHDEKVQRIKTVLQNEQSHPTVHSSETEHEIADMLRRNDEHKARQEHFHCHSIARYKPSMPHSDSARYRPSSHVPPVRSNPFRFFKSAR